MEQKICQSCGMPLCAETYSTNKDGSENTDYCGYCYKEGEFTQDVDMETMIANCVEYLDEFNKDSEKKYTKEEAIAEMKKYFPLLKRWQN